MTRRSRLVIWSQFLGNARHAGAPESGWGHLSLIPVRCLGSLSVERTKAKGGIRCQFRPATLADVRDIAEDEWFRRVAVFAWCLERAVRIPKRPHPWTGVPSLYAHADNDHGEAQGQRRANAMNIGDDLNSRWRPRWPSTQLTSKAFSGSPLCDLQSHSETCKIRMAANCGQQVTGRKLAYRFGGGGRYGRWRIV